MGLTALRCIAALARVAALVFFAGMPLRGRAGEPAPIDTRILNRGPSSLRLWSPYRPMPLPPLNTQNGSLLEEAIHNGKLELSLAEFLRLVVENGLDIESDRYTYLLAQTDLLRARSGQAARGIPQAPIPSALFAGAIGAGVGNNANVSTAGTGAAAISAAAKQIVIGARGNFDPTFSLNFSLDRVVSPLNTVRVAGTPTVTVPSAVLQTRFQQELPWGSSYSVSFNLQRQSTTQRFLLFNPAFTSYLSFQIYQPLLNGFGVALNRRFITVAENDRKISREVFNQNLQAIISKAANLYWDYAALRKKVEVAEEAVAASEKLYEDDQREFEIGILARLDVVQAQSQLAANRRDLVIAQTDLQMQEVRLKSVISKNISPALADARIEPTERLPEPNDIQIPALADAVRDASKDRSSLRLIQLTMDNQQIAEKFTRNNLLPTFSAFAAFNSYSLASGTNAMFRQMAQWVYPEYSAGFSLTFTIRNRAAQADDVRDRLELQQTRVSLQRTRNQAEQTARTAVIGLTQFRAQVEADQRAVENSQQAFRGEQIRLANGISTPYRVILAQRDLATAQAVLIQAQVNYGKALIALELAEGTILERNGINFDQAFRGSLWKTDEKP
jgi:outer membrane protein